MSDKATLKSYFQTGAKPTQSQFEDLIDSLLPDIAAGTFLANSSGSTAPPVARTAQQMGVLSAVDTQTFDSAGKALVRTNIGVVVWEGVYFEDGVTYTYYGGLANNAWKINRFSSAAVKTSATIANNPSVTTLSAAWAARTGLTYT